MPRWDCGYARKELQKRGRNCNLHYPYQTRNSVVNRKVEIVLPAILPSRDRDRHESGMGTNAAVVPSERSVIICLITSGFRGHNGEWRAHTIRYEIFSHCKLVSPFICPSRR